MTDEEAWLKRKAHELQFYRMNDKLSNRIAMLKCELEDAQNEANKIRMKHHLLFGGNCYVYIGQFDRLNKVIESLTMLDVYQDIMDSVWIDVLREPKDRLGFGSIEYKLENGKFIMTRHECDTGD